MKKRVCAYARVSTNSRSQEHSLSTNNFYKAGYNAFDVYYNLLEAFKTKFFQWVLKTNQDNRDIIADEEGNSIETLKLSLDDFYFTFNYTDTLETTYGIYTEYEDIKHIIHIHNRATENRQVYSQKNSRENAVTFGNVLNTERFKKETDTDLKRLYGSFSKDPQAWLSYQVYGIYAKNNRLYIEISKRYQTEVEEKKK